MPIILKVDPNTGTIYTDNGTTTTPTTGTCLVMSGSPIGAIPGVQGNLALDSTSGQVYLCTVTGSTAATATWIAAFSQNNQPNNFADTQTMAALDVTGNATVGGNLGVTGAATLSDTLDVTGNATVGGNLSYLPYVIAPTASQTLPNNQKVICQTGTLTADITLTTGSPPVGGEAIIYGSAAAYTTTVSTGVTSGSPYIEMPDGSQVYSYVIPASSPSAGIRLVWDGTNYHATTFGQTVVAPATASNQAVALGQFTSGGNATAGWRKGPDGFIEQWGQFAPISVAATSVVSETVTFDTSAPFTTAPMVNVGIVGSGLGTTYGGTAYLQSGSVTTTQFSVSLVNLQGGVEDVGFTWTARGR